MNAHKGCATRTAWSDIDAACDKWWGRTGEELRLARLALYPTEEWRMIVAEEQAFEIAEDFA